MKPPGGTWKRPNFFQKALARGHYPEARAGLGRLERIGGNLNAARGHLLAALDLKRIPGEGSIGTILLAGGILSELVALEPQVEDCRAWFATLNGGTGPEAFANHSFVIYSRGRQQAEEYFNELLMAMHPGSPPPPPGTIGWETAPQEQQPIVPVRPGVQGFFTR